MRGESAVRRRVWLAVCVRLGDARDGTFASSDLRSELPQKSGDEVHSLTLIFLLTLSKCTPLLRIWL